MTDVGEQRWLWGGWKDSFMEAKVDAELEGWKKWRSSGAFQTEVGHRLK